MNFLAHLYLSFDDENILIGNFIADMIQNKDLKELQPKFIEGINLHRKIDRFTDQHPNFRAGVKRLRSQQRKYAPVVLDILYDFLLANSWQRFAEIDLDIFIVKTYDTLHSHLGELPPKLQERIPLMISDNFLHQYTSYTGLDKAMKRMDRRTRFPSQFVQSVEALQENFEVYNEEFDGFFIDVISFVKSEM